MASKVGGRLRVRFPFFPPRSFQPFRLQTLFPGVCGHAKELCEGLAIVVYKAEGLDGELATRTLHTTACYEP